MVIFNPKNYIEDLCTAIFRKKMQNKFPKVRGEQRPFGFSSVLVPTPVPYLQIINQEDLFRQGGFSTIPPDFQYQISQSELLSQTKIIFNKPSSLSSSLLDLVCRHIARPPCLGFHRHGGSCSSFPWNCLLLLIFC